MGDTSGRIAGSFDHHVHRIVRARLDPALGEACSADASLFPTDGPARAARMLRVEICDDRHFKGRDSWHLGEEHRAELSSADQRCADWQAGFLAGREEMCQVHGKDRPVRIHGVLQKKKINSRAAASDDMAVTGSQACGAARGASAISSGRCLFLQSCFEG